MDGACVPDPANCHEQHNQPSPGSNAKSHWAPPRGSSGLAKMPLARWHLSVALNANFALLVSSMHLFRAWCEADHMSTFVEIDPSEYDEDAFADFDASMGDFRMGNARALIWLSQLAYEAHRQETIDEVAQKWRLVTVIPFIKRKTGLNGSYETCGIVAQRDDAVLLAFAGTDPGIWQNLVTDATVLSQAGSDIHAGFRAGALAARGEIDRAVLLSQQSQKPLFI